MAHANQVDAILRARGVARHVIQGGLPGLVERWERFAGEVEAGYRGNIHEWLNDVDGRDILADVLGFASADERRRVDLADARVRARSVPAGRCLWGAENARKHEWSAERHWWYYVQPARPIAQLADDLAALRNANDESEER